MLTIRTSKYRRYQAKSPQETIKTGLFSFLSEILPASDFFLLFLQAITQKKMDTNLTTYNLLNRIATPDDLRRLPVDQLPEVCRELRQDIIEEVSRNPGHFAASLGTVELTVALHYVYRTPYDRIVWDVGHQPTATRY